MSIKYNPIGFIPDEVYDEENPIPFILANWNYQDQPQTYKQLMAERDKVKSEISFAFSTFVFSYMKNKGREIG
jgi:hypothetical protein